MREDLYNKLLYCLSKDFSINNKTKFILEKFEQITKITTNKKFFNTQFYLLYSTKISDINEGLAEIEKHKHFQKYTIIWLKHYSDEMELNEEMNCLYFNDALASFVHIIHFQNEKVLKYDKDFYYVGAKHIKRAMNSIVSYIKNI